MNDDGKQIQTEEDLPSEIRDELLLLSIPGAEPAECVELLERVLESYPYYVQGKLNLALFLLDLAETDRAKTLYSEIIEEHPSENGALAGLATVLAAEGDYSQAEGLAQKALDAGYLWPPCYEVLGQSREAAGEPQAAAEHFLAAYRASPHSWKYLESYCRLTDRRFTPPTDTVRAFITNPQLLELAQYIESEANKPDSSGNIPGCDHTFRFTERWAEENGLDVVELYQFLNSEGGFCDCEVCYNVVPEDGVGSRLTSWVQGAAGRLRGWLSR